MYDLEGKEGNVLFNHTQHILFTVIWYRMYDLEGKEGNVLFNDALNTFYLRLYGVGCMIWR